MKVMGMIIGILLAIYAVQCKVGYGYMKQRDTAYVEMEEMAWVIKTLTFERKHAVRKWKEWEGFVIASTGEDLSHFEFDLQYGWLPHE